MKKNMILNISKSISQKVRYYRINYILHPMYYLQLSFKKIVDSQRHIGWKYDISYDISFESEDKWSEMLDSLSAQSKILMIQYLFTIAVGRKPYYGIHNIYFDRLSDEDERIVRENLELYDISDEILLNAAIIIDGALSKYFKYRNIKHIPIGYIKPKPIIYYDLYIYGKIDFYRKKVRFLISEEYLLKYVYDAPMIVLRYEATPQNPMLANIVFPLKDKGYIEVLYRWIEDILEKHCEVLQISDDHFILQKDLYDIIGAHPKTAFLKNILASIQFEAMIGIITQVGNKIKKDFIKLKHVKEILQASDTPESRDIINTQSPILVFPGSSLFNNN